MRDSSLVVSFAVPACILPPASLLVRLAVDYVHAVFWFWRILYLDELELGMRMCRVNHFVCPSAAVCVDECKHAARFIVIVPQFRAGHSEFPPSLRRLTKGKSGAKPVDEGKDYS